MDLVHICNRITHNNIKPGNRKYNTIKEYICFFKAFWVLVLTDSSSDDVTIALVIAPALMFARTGAPKPIEASCRLGKKRQF
jgi:hypothetical protein